MILLAFFYLGIDKISRACYNKENKMKEKDYEILRTMRRRMRG